jgi:hypothetical protein
MKSPMAPPTPSRASSLARHLRASASRLVGTLAALILFSVLTAGTVDAQQRTSFGITGGATVGDLYGGGINTDSRWGATVGLTAGIRSFNYTVTQLEVSWIQKGGDGARLDYIEVPLLFGGVAQTASGRGGRLYSGIGVSFPIGCSLDEAPNFSCDGQNIEWTWPIGLQMGQWLQGGRMVALDVRYSLSLTDAFENAFPQNRSWQFRLIIGRQR